MPCTRKAYGHLSFLTAMEKKKPPKEAIRDSAGFRLVKAVRDQFDARYGQRGTTVKVEKLLANLPGKIPDRAESDFLKEALTCFHNTAYRAAIVMTWNLTFFHLCDYVLKHKLADFNAGYPRRYPGIHKKAKAPTIATYDDFASDLKESEVTEICRSANIITRTFQRPRPPDRQAQFRRAPVYDRHNGIASGRVHP